MPPTASKLPFLACQKERCRSEQLIGALSCAAGSHLLSLPQEMVQVKTADMALPLAAGALSPALEALLFEAVGGRKLPPVMRVCLRAECPKLGVALHVGRDWAPLAAVRTEAAFGFLEVSLQSIEAQLSSNGEQAWAGASLFTCSC